VFDIAGDLTLNIIYNGFGDVRKVANYDKAKEDF